ncbi:MAG: bifunctional phosphopantothenoylcysteine decarboxylase/phosphopantothenate--cysteine ligase CoaBC [Candidatus Marinimicrobia bacterium]|nr:bifunctional phosphopantothenoylcysteine decarboxylase/phosphopantothenate--cysteine ligase CoaBC [Candidatus Neomarinimicrobiota bacterium]
MMSALKNKRILLGVTGSIAAYKACEIIRLLRKSGAEVQAVMTKSATEFVGPTTFSALTGKEVLTDMFIDPPPPGEIHLHIAENVDIIVVAPATANILAKTAQGIADDLLSTVLLVSDVPLLFAPAMHHNMWQNRATQTNMDTLKKHGRILIQPDYGSLANLATGEGRMAEPAVVVSKIREILGIPQDFHGKRVLVTAGPTREPIDTVRFISNRSSGKMGFALAQAAIDRGAEVTLITGPVYLKSPEMCSVVTVETAEDMNRAVRKISTQQDFIIMAAAVGDFALPSPQKSKIKLPNHTLTLKLQSTPDILKGLRSISDAFIVGFALETEDGEKNALKKMKEKRLDAIVLNYANQPGTGFETDTNEGTLFLRGEKKGIHLPLESKMKMAHRILTEVKKVAAKEPMKS